MDSVIRLIAFQDLVQLSKLKIIDDTKVIMYNSNQLEKRPLPYVKRLMNECG